MKTSLHELVGRLGAGKEEELAEPILEEIHWQSLRALQDRDQTLLRELGASAGAKAREWLAAAPGAGQATRRVSDAGQLACLAALARAALARELPDSVQRLLRRKNVRRLLRLLRDKDLQLTELAREARIDVSQTSRELERLAKADLIRTAKQEHERWVRITALGRTALGGKTGPTLGARVKQQEDLVAARLDQLATWVSSVNTSLAAINRALAQIQQPRLLRVKDASVLKGSVKIYTRHEKEPASDQFIVYFSGDEGFGLARKLFRKEPFTDEETEELSRLLEGHAERTKGEAR